MKKNKSTDFVTGRLSGSPGTRNESVPKKKDSSYGKDRLGLSYAGSESAMPATPEAPVKSVVPADSAKPATPAPAKKESPSSLRKAHKIPRRSAIAAPQITRPKLKSEESKPAPIPAFFDPMASTTQPLTQSRPDPLDLLKFWKHGPQATVVGAMFLGLLAMGILWTIASLFGEGSITPKKASATPKTSVAVTGGGRSAVRQRPVRSSDNSDNSRRKSLADAALQYRQKTSRQTDANSGQKDIKQKRWSIPVETSKPDVDEFPNYITCPAGFRLAGVFNTPTGKLANINGQFLAVGDDVNGARIVEINNFAVELERQGMRFLLSTSGGRVPIAEEKSDEESEDDESEDEEEKKNRRSSKSKKSRLE